MVLVPKDADADLSDRRPLTIITLTSRIWSLHQAGARNEGFASWHPSGLRGATLAQTCHAIMWELETRFQDARNVGGQAFVLSMDLSQCFGRFASVNLLHIVVPLGLWPCVHALQNDHRLQRLLMVDGEPIYSWLRGDLLGGVSQGCALSGIFCTVAGAAWMLHVMRGLPDAKAYTYLGDRIVVVNTSADLAILLRLIAEVHRCGLHF